MGGTSSHGDDNFDFYLRNVSYAKTGGGAWVATGLAGGNGHGGSHSNYLGGGGYGGPDFAGTVSEGGGQGSGYNYAFTAILDPTLQWVGVGTGHSSGSSSDQSTYAGTGTYSETTTSPTETRTRSGTTDAAGGQYNFSNDSADYTLAASGWAMTGGTALASGSSSDHTDFSGGGTYARSENGGTVSGGFSEGGSNDNTTSSHVTSLNTGGDWSTTGTAIGSSSGSTQFGFSGSGTYAAGVISGTVQESGSGARPTTAPRFTTSWAGPGCSTAAAGRRPAAPTPSTRTPGRGPTNRYQTTATSLPPRHHRPPGERQRPVGRQLADAVRGRGGLGGRRRDRLGLRQLQPAHPGRGQRHVQLPGQRRPDERHALVQRVAGPLLPVHDRLDVLRQRPVRRRDVRAAGRPRAPAPAPPPARANPPTRAAAPTTATAAAARAPPPAPRPATTAR